LLSEQKMTLAARVNGMGTARETVPATAIMKTSTCRAFAVDFAALALCALASCPALGQIQFERITTGEVVTDVGTSFGCSWVDYDDDGWVDLFVANGYGQPSCLYRNNRDGTFRNITTGPVVMDGGDSGIGVWADFDNDGDSDLYVSNFDPPNDFYYRNDGNGSFTRVVTGPLVNDGLKTASAAAADYDNDGWLDLFVAHPFGNDLLYRNIGLGEFERILKVPVVTSNGTGISGSWADYDNDGDLDLYVANASTSGQKNFLFRNEGDGQFARVVEGDLVNDVAVSQTAAWGDYDNDGDLDLFVSNYYRHDNFLYRNEGGGTFSRVTDQPVVVDGGNSTGAVWADLDNDGFLDLLVANAENEDNRLYRNQRDGTFVESFDGPLPWDGGGSSASAVADFDNDGDLDVYIANNGCLGETWAPEANFFYRNVGEGNAWIILRLVGTVSNRSAVGARVRVQTTIWGKPTQQLRQVSAGEGYYIQNDLRPHFGLGDAAIIDTLRIEWPSGIVQELKEVVANQILTVSEPARLIAQRSGGFEIKSWVNQSFEVQVSTDLVDWTTVTTVTNETGTLMFEDAAANQHAQRYYRVATPAR
jgi:hypothetical protein